MTKAQKELVIEFGLRKDGVFFEGPSYNKVEHSRKNLPFKATLTYRNFYVHANLCNIEWYDEERNTVYRSNMTLFDDYLKTGNLIGNTITDTFVFQKKGDSLFLVKYE